MSTSEMTLTGATAMMSDEPISSLQSSARAEFAVPWDDHSAVALSASFTRFLMSRPNLDDVTRFLVALLCAPVGGLGALITSTDGSRVDTVSQYVELLPAWPSENELLPSIAEKVAETPLGLARVVAATWTDPDLISGQAVSIWPLGTTSGSVHTLVLLHATQLEVTQIKRRVKELAEILAVYLLSPPRALRDAEADFVSVDAGRTAAASLTPRQCRVIDLMAEGLTNRQIASRIGFSESTVHLEGLAAYRALGVHTRRGAVTAARALGLIGPADAPRDHRATA